MGGFTLSPVEKVKKDAKTTLSDKGHLLPERFPDDLTASLAHILSLMGAVSTTELVSFENRLRDIADYVSKIKDRLASERDAELDLRMSRVRSGRARKKIQHSLKFLRDAELIRSDMEELGPGVVDFQPARKALERLETTFSNLESTAAALIHPNLRKSDEKSIANRTPYTLSHPEFKPTPESQKVMHRAVEMLDDEILKFTRGKVKAGSVHVHEFIREFLKVLGWKVDVANVKTIRARYYERKRLAETVDRSAPQE
jgi:hypothetical protein